MNLRQSFFNTPPLGLVLCATIVTILTGCSSHRDRPYQGNVYISSPPPETVVVMQDDYVYYPYYQVYYSESRRQYAYRDGNAWVARPAPRGVSVNVLLASPSVRMNFHDSPANHHAAVVREYPKTWVPPGSNQGRKEKQPDGQHGDNYGK
jgi:hypothetical protein